MLNETFLEYLMSKLQMLEDSISHSPKQDTCLFDSM